MKNKKLFGWILLMVLGALTLSGCTSGGTPASADTSSAKTDPFATIKRIQAAKVLKVGTTAGYFPFEMTDTNGDVIGFDAELAQKIADELDVELEIKDMDFNGLIPALQAGTIDLVLAGITITPQRALTVNFTKPYFKTGQAVLVNKKHAGTVKSYIDLDKPGMVITVQMGTTGDISASKTYKEATVKRFDTSNNAALEVAQGRADAMVFDQPDVAIHAKTYPDTTYGILEPFTIEQFGIPVAPGQPDLVAWLDSFLDSLVGTLEYERMYQHWFVEMPWWNDVEL